MLFLSAVENFQQTWKFSTHTHSIFIILVHKFSPRCTNSSKQTGSSSPSLSFCFSLINYIKKNYQCPWLSVTESRPTDHKYLICVDRNFSTVQVPIRLACHIPFENYDRPFTELVGVLQPLPYGKLRPTSFFCCCLFSSSMSSFQYATINKGTKALGT